MAQPFHSSIHTCRETLACVLGDMDWNVHSLFTSNGSKLETYLLTVGFLNKLCCVHTIRYYAAVK